MNDSVVYMSLGILKLAKFYFGACWLSIQIGRCTYTMDMLFIIMVILIIYMGISKLWNRNKVDITVSNEIQGDLETRIKNFILEGQMVKAVKEYRMATGAGLMEAKNYVDVLAAAIKEGKSIEDYKKPELSDEEIEAKVRKLISEGQKIKAVKAYREATGCDLLTAKKYVDSL